MIKLRNSLSKAIYLLDKSPIILQIPNAMTPTVEAHSGFSTGTDQGIGGTLQEYQWTWKKRRVSVIYETLGYGSPILLLPAFSSISSRTEMRGLAELLAPHFQVIAVDWPGFGSSERPPFNYEPALYLSFLGDFVRDNFNEQIVVITAGHGAGYVMQLPQLWSWVVLVAPTWRGPLPTMMGEKRWFFNIIKKIIYLPIIGQFLYFLNTLPPFLRLMIGRHVFANPNSVTPDFIKQKHKLTQKKGARFASAAFVTGGLDIIKSRSKFVELFQPLPVPVLVAIPEESPSKSRMEMEVLVSFTSTQKCWLPGSLGLHEENPTGLAEIIIPFLKKFLSRNTYVQPEEDQES